MKLRFAPSPTGFLHVGNARTLLLNWLYAKHYHADFILRFDDTDQERSKEEYVAQIIEDMAWLELGYSAIYKQSERLDLYAKMAQKLKDEGWLYPCYETKQELDFKRKRLLSQGRPPIYDRAALDLSTEQIAAFEAEGRTPHWRFKLDKSKTIAWQDLAHGSLEFKSENLSDPIVIRENGAYLFTFSGVVDDIDLGITHIIRGDDHITNTAIQIQILEALGKSGDDFKFGHVPLLTLLSGEGLSKRFGSLSLKELRASGYEARAVQNYLANLGNPSEAYTNFSLEELAQRFDLEAFGKSAPKFSLEELEKTNAKILHEMPYDEVKSHLGELKLGHITADFWDLARANIARLQDLQALDQICHGVLAPVISSEDQDYLQEALALFPQAPLDDSSWKNWTTALKAQTGRKGKELFMPLRKALTGEEHGPEMAKFLPFIEYERAKVRLAGQSA